MIQTKRLTLRPVSTADAPALATAMCDWQVVRWLTAIPWPYTFERSLADSHWFLEKQAGPALAVMVQGQFAGVVQIDESPTLGFWLDSRFHGQGLMTEAVMASVAAHFREGGATLASGHHLENTASARVLIKLGFRTTGHELEPTVRGGAVVMRRMALTAADWQASATAQDGWADVNKI